MAKSTNHSVLGVYFDLVPAASDPPNAAVFYQCLGIAVVAWGRLEGNYNNVFLTVLNVANNQTVGDRFYIQRERSAKVWKLAFEITPSLTPHKTAAFDFIDKMEKLSDLRDMMVHGLWRGFVPGYLAMEVSKIKQTRGSPETIQHKSGIISLGMIRTFALETNLLNKSLGAIADNVIPLRGAAPPRARRL